MMPGRLSHTTNHPVFVGALFHSTPDDLCHEIAATGPQQALAHTSEDRPGKDSTKRAEAQRNGLNAILKDDGQGGVWTLYKRAEDSLCRLSVL
jgi:hypothetical protein